MAYPIQVDCYMTTSSSRPLSSLSITFLKPSELWLFKIKQNQKYFKVQLLGLKLITLSTTGIITKL